MALPASGQRLARRSRVNPHGGTRRPSLPQEGPPASTPFRGGTHHCLTGLQHLPRPSAAPVGIPKAQPPVSGNKQTTLPTFLLPSATIPPFPHLHSQLLCSSFSSTALLLETPRPPGHSPLWPPKVCSPGLPSKHSEPRVSGPPAPVWPLPMDWRRRMWGGGAAVTQEGQGHKACLAPH